MSPARLDEQGIRQWIAEYVAKVTERPAAEITAASDFDAHGLDSVDSVLITGALEDRLGVEIDPTLFMRSRNIDEVIVELRRAGLLG